MCPDYKAFQPIDETSYTLIDKLKVFGKDDPCWKRFEDTYKPRIFAWAKKSFNKTGLHNLEEDFVQEILMKLYKDIQKYDPQMGKFRCWLKTVVTNALISYKKKRGNRPLHTGNESLLAALPAAEAERLAENLSNACLDGDPEDLFMVYLMAKKQFLAKGGNIDLLRQFEKRYEEQLHYEEIAREGNYSIGSVRTSVSRVKARLEELSKEIRKELGV